MKSFTKILFCGAPAKAIARTSEERKEQHLRYPHHNKSFRNMTPKQTENAYRVLEDIGFVGSGDVEIMTDEELLAENAKD